MSGANRESVRKPPYFQVSRVEEEDEFYRTRKNKGARETGRPWYFVTLPLATARQYAHPAEEAFATRLPTQASHHQDHLPNQAKHTFTI